MGGVGERQGESGGRSFAAVCKLSTDRGWSGHVSCEDNKKKKKKKKKKEIHNEKKGTRIVTQGMEKERGRKPKTGTHFKKDQG